MAFPPHGLLFPSRPSRDSEKVRQPPGVQGALSVTPCPQSCFHQDEPLGHTSQGSQDRLFLAAVLPALCLPTVLLTPACPQLP